MSISLMVFTESVGYTLPYEVVYGKAFATNRVDWKAIISTMKNNRNNTCKFYKQKAYACLQWKKFEHLLYH